MKISLHIPKEANADSVRSFLKQEIAQARNIKDKQERKSVVLGLGKLLNNVEPGMSFFTDGEEFLTEPYDGI